MAKWWHVVINDLDGGGYEVVEAASMEAAVAKVLRLEREVNGGKLDGDDVGDGMFTRIVVCRVAAPLKPSASRRRAHGRIPVDRP